MNPPVSPEAYAQATLADFNDRWRLACGCTKVVREVRAEGGRFLCVVCDAVLVLRREVRR